MTCNVGLVDRILRIIIGAALIYLAVSGAIGWWGWLGSIFVITGIFRWCPIYSVIGFKTGTPK